MFIRNGGIVRLGKLLSIKPQSIRKPTASSIRYLSSNVPSKDLPRFASHQPLKHILVFKAGELSLWKHNPLLNEYLKLSEAMITTREYNILKEISHLPFLIQTLLMSDNLNDANLLLQKKSELRKIHQDVLEISQKIHLDGDDSKNQQSILKKTLAFLTQLIHHPESEQINLQDKVATYLKSVSFELDRNKALATQVQLTTLNKAVEDFRSDYSIRLEDTETIIVGPHGPRRGLIEKQYFESLYQQEKSLSNPIHYVEYLAKDIPSIDIEKDLINGYLNRYSTQVEQVAERFVSEVKDNPSETIGGEKNPTLSSLGVAPAGERALENLNQQFLAAHHQAATHMLNSVKTIFIYFEGVLTCWQQDSVTKQYSCLQQKACINPQEVVDVLKGLPIDLLKSRFVVCGDNSSGGLQSFIDFFVGLYREKSMQAKNCYVYHIESSPKDKDILKHVIESFLPEAELNKKYGEALKNNSNLMFTDVLADYASQCLSRMCSDALPRNNKF